jgi:hypothetical protein
MEMFNNVNIKRVLSPVSVADNTAQVGEVVDHQGFGDAMYVIATGSLGDAGAEFTVLLEESDASGSGYAAVADADMLGTEVLASFIQSDDNKCFKLGYKCTKRYSRMTITPTNNATASLIAAVCILGAPAVAPTANPPA